jgi:hypothetical protein
MPQKLSFCWPAFDSHKIINLRKNTSIFSNSQKSKILRILQAPKIYSWDSENHWFSQPPFFILKAMLGLF